MTNHTPPFRKRASRQPADKTAESRALREISELVSRRDHSAGLEKVRNLMRGSAARDSMLQGRALALTADSEFKRGRFAEAADIYIRAATMLSTHHERWFRPLVGGIRAHLRAGNLDEAWRIAVLAHETATHKRVDFERAVALATAQLAATGRAVVPPKPTRVSVVCTRIGFILLQEGETTTAREMFNRALSDNPKGAARARQGLAFIALGEDEPAVAYNLALASIQCGSSSAKTIAAWPILIRASRKLGRPRLGDSILNELTKSPPSVRARALVVICQAMRAAGYTEWERTATEWLAGEGGAYPWAQAELRKLFLADTKAENGRLLEKRAAAEALMSTDALSFNEWLSATKEYIRCRLFEGNDVDMERFIASAAARFGDSRAYQARHGIALSCMMAKRHGTARQLLEYNIARQTCPSHVRGKSLWALARMEYLLGNYSRTADLYRVYWETDVYEQKFRLQARARWVEALVRDNQPGAIEAARPAISDVLRGIEDPELRINFARHLALCAAEFKPWAASIFNDAADEMRSSFEKTEHPSVAIDTLLKLTRRQIYEFDRHDDVVSFWESLDASRRTWLWSNSGAYWEYLSLLITAYARSGRIDVTDDLAIAWINDPATPPDGRACIGISYGRTLIAWRRINDAMELFEQLTSEAPANPLCAYAWYWKALRAYRDNNAADRDLCVANLRKAQGVAVGLRSEWELDAKGHLLLVDLDPSRLDAQVVNYSSDFLARVLAELEQELALL